MQRTKHTITKKDQLTLKQRLFCQYYLETRGNGAEAAIKAGYGVTKDSGLPDRRLAKSIASENLTKPHLLAYLNTLLEKSGLNDQMVSAHLAFLINQFSDLPVKLRAIDMYYKLHGKYAPEKIDNQVGVELESALARMAQILPRAGA
jgi:hypothetical protein